MKNDSILPHCPLFSGIDQDELSDLLACLGAEQTQCQKGEYIWSAGEIPSRIGVVLSGGIDVIQEDYWGNRAILARVVPGEIFGEAFAFGDPQPLPVSVVASGPAVLLLLDLRKILIACPGSCSFHTRLIQNMLGILAQKNRMLTEKIKHIVKRSTREKLLSYLSSQTILAGSESFCIPFNRQELADYLSVERSAMSRELGRLRDEGILVFDKNRFSLMRFSKPK